MLLCRATRGALVAALFAITGCGAQTVAPQIARSAEVHKASASGGDLLYAGSYYSGKLYAFSYPGLTLEQTVQLDGYAVALCNDPAGDVYVAGGASVDQPTVWEYAHGGSEPIETLHGGLADTQFYTACSYDPTTGNLAVAARTGAPSSSDYISVFPSGGGAPTQYTDAAVSAILSCTYDSSGNLYVDGYAPNGGNGHAKLIELPKGSTSFINIAFNRPLHRWGNIQWGSDFLAMETKTHLIYQVTVKGPEGVLKHKTKVTGFLAYWHWWLNGSTLITPYGKDETGVALYNFPQGGAPIKTVTVPDYDLRSVTISTASTSTHIGK